MRQAQLSIALFAATLALSACVYRPAIQQGNLLKASEIEEVTPGMTRSQVRYLLGTPMVSDPFNPQRWDYIYRLESGRGRHRNLSSAHFVVYFDGDAVSRVETLDPPDPPVVEERKWWRVDGPKLEGPPLDEYASEAPGDAPIDVETDLSSD
jgi:outer membrane protein assembly factor BamE